MTGSTVILFDAVGTLFYLPKSVGYHYSLVAGRFGVDIQEEALNSAFRQAWKAVPPPVSTRTARPDDDRGWWRELVFRVLDATAPGALIEREIYFSELYEYFAKPGIWELYPEVKGTLASLHGRYRLGIVSNFDSRLRAILGYLEIAGYFDFLAISSEVGADKPDPYIFERALSAAGVSAEQAVHVGDDPLHDEEGAKAAGIRCFRVDRPRTSLAGLEAWLARPENGSGL